MRVLGTVLIVLVTAGGGALGAQQPAVAVPATPTQTAPVPAVPGAPLLPTGRVFGSEAGMIFNPIRPDKVLDFEMVLGRIHDALMTSTDAVRRQQAAGWKVFRAVEPGPNGTALYVFVMDPAVKGADYTISRILSDAFPLEVQEIWKLYTAAYAGSQSLLNLQTVQDFGNPLKMPIRKMPPPAAVPAAPPTALPAVGLQ